MNINCGEACVGYEKSEPRFFKWTMAKTYRDIVICTPSVEENPVPNCKTSTREPNNTEKMFTRVGGMPAAFDLLLGMKRMRVIQDCRLNSQQMVWYSR